MTEDERHPIGEFLERNRNVLAILYLYEHPDKDGSDGEDFENWLCELLDDGMRQHYDRLYIMHLDPEKRYDE